MCAFFDALLLVLDNCWWVLFVAAVMSWLHAFGVVNRYNRAVATIDDMLVRITEPMLRPIRRTVPPLGGVDVSFIVLIVLIYLAQRLIIRNVACYY
jgi:YggT family protein